MTSFYHSGCTQTAATGYYKNLWKWSDNRLPAWVCHVVVGQFVCQSSVVGHFSKPIPLLKVHRDVLRTLVIADNILVPSAGVLVGLGTRLCWQVKCILHLCLHGSDALAGPNLNPNPNDVIHSVQHIGPDNAPEPWELQYTAVFMCIRSCRTWGAKVVPPYYV